MDAEELDAVEGLVAARRGGPPSRPIAEVVPGIDLPRARQVRDALIARLLAEGAALEGYKVALSSPVARTAVQAEEPELGALLSGTVVRSTEAPLPAGLRVPRLEPELAVVLARPLRGPGVDRAAAAAATGAVAAAFEIVDARGGTWSQGLVDLVADNAAGAGAILGEARTAWEDVDLDHLEMVLRVDGEEVGRATGGGDLDHPLDTVAWVANALAPAGVGLEAGHVVLTGAWIKPWLVTGPGVVEVDLGPVGAVRCVVPPA